MFRPAFVGLPSRAVAVLVVLALAPAARAQTDYFWNSNNGTNSGGAGTWDTLNPMWGTSATGPNNYTWQNTGSERANFGGTGDVVTVTGGITAYGLVFTVDGYTISGGPVMLTGTGTVINNTTAGNSATISSALTFGAAGQTVASAGTLTLGSAASPSTITTQGTTGTTALTFAPGAAGTIVINDVIQDPASGGGGVAYAGSAGGVIQINAQNTYTGPTFFNGPASVIRFGTDSNAAGTAGPFGASAATLNFTNTTNNHLQPTGGTRTVANPITMQFGFTVESAPGDTTSGLTFTGPITLTTAGRTITNNLASGATLTLGSAATPSTFTLSTGASTQTLVIGGTGRYVINDVIQNSSPTNPNNLSLTTTSSVTFNAQNTYSGTTTLTGNGTSPVTVFLGASSNALPGSSFTAGPFGIGTVNMNNSNGPPILVPIGADRLVSNAITMTTGFFVASAGAAQDPTGAHNLTLAGPILLAASGRVLTNNLAPGVQLILGSATAPSTVTLATNTNQSLTFQRTATSGGTTVINDVIQSGGVAGNLVVQNNATVFLNAANTYSGITTVKNGGVLSTNLLADGGTASNLGLSSNAAASLVVDGGTFQYTGPAVSTDRLFTLSQNGGTLDASGTGAVNFTNPGSMGLSGTTARTLTLTGTNTGADTLAAVIGDVSSGNATSLTKTGAGTWVLAGNNTYSGDTNVNAGTLLVTNAAGSGTGTGNVKVNSTGTLGGTGIIAPGSGNGVTVASGGTLFPGTAAAPTGALKVNGPVTLQSGGQFAAALGSNASPTSNSLDLSGGGSVNFATGSKLTLAAPAGGFSNTGGPATYTLATTGPGNGGNIKLDGASVADQQVIGAYVAGTGPSGAVVIDPGSITLASGNTFTLFRNGDNLALAFSPTPVPEPGQVLLVCGAAAGGLGWWHRRRA